MKIAITDNMGSEHKLQMYYNWLKNGDPDLDIVKMSYVQGNLSELSGCDGIVMTGGSDVDPVLYGGDIRHPKLGPIDHKRDDFELSVVSSALENEMPFLGICRGLQITNVHLGGDLILDLEELGYRSHKGNQEHDNRHPIKVMGPGVLRNIVQDDSGEVNSAHHQAASNPGKNLRVSGISDDGVIEAMEFMEGIYSSFFLLVQWHPERMNDNANPFCKNILNAFIQSTKTKETIHKLL